MKKPIIFLGMLLFSMISEVDLKQSKQQQDQLQLLKSLQKQPNHPSLQHQALKSKSNLKDKDHKAKTYKKKKSSQKSKNNKKDQKPEKQNPNKNHQKSNKQISQDSKGLSVAKAHQKSQDLKKSSQDSDKEKEKEKNYDRKQKKQQKKDLNKKQPSNDKQDKKHQSKSKIASDSEDSDDVKIKGKKQQKTLKKESSKKQKSDRKDVEQRKDEKSDRKDVEQRKDKKSDKKSDRKDVEQPKDEKSDRKDVEQRKDKKSDKKSDRKDVEQRKDKKPDRKDVEQRKKSDKKSEKKSDKINKSTKDLKKDSKSVEKRQDNKKSKNNQKGQKNSNDIKKLNPNDFKLLQQKLTIIDTRPAAQDGLIKGSYWFADEQIIQKWIGVVLKKDTDYLLVTEKGKQKETVEMFKKLGYKNIKGINGFDVKDFSGEKDVPAIKQKKDLELEKCFNLNLKSNKDCKGVTKKEKKVPNSMVIPLNELEERVDELKGKENIVINCKDQSEAKVAYSMLAKKGIYCYVLSEGTQELSGLGYTIVKY